MQVDRASLGAHDPFARFPSGAFSTVPAGLVRAMAERRVASNGWPVMIALCRRIYADGTLDRCGREEIAAMTGLGYRQVARGMAELRDKGLIVPVVRKNSRGYRHPDRSNFGHVAQYCIARDVWARVKAASGRGPSKPVT